MTMDRVRQARINRIAQDLARLKKMRNTAPMAENIGDEGAPEAKAQPGYRFLRVVGEGAMSRVYLAKRLSDMSTLVLKLIDTRMRREDTLVKRFIREAKLISQLNNPFVVRIYDHGFTDNHGYIAMEYFPRGDLKKRIPLGITPYQALTYMRHLACGLTAIHGVGVVHRDLKPANLMFRRDDTMVLADFGISKNTNSRDEELTMVGQVLGTPYYMSPEQGQGLLVDSRSDLYSAGIILYELLTREKPYSARTPSALIYQHIHADIPRLPASLYRFQPLVNSLLAKDPESRCASAKELADMLQAAITEIEERSRMRRGLRSPAAPH